MRFGTQLLRFWVDFPSQNHPEIHPKWVPNQVLDLTYFWSLFCMIFARFPFFFGSFFGLFSVRPCCFFFHIFAFPKIGDTPKSDDVIEDSMLPHCFFKATFFHAGCEKTRNLLLFLLTLLIKKSVEKTSKKHHDFATKNHGKSTPEPPKMRLGNRSASRTQFFVIFGRF